jgi:inorganic pyrophosphatase/exopolyphosphatase
LKDLKLIATYFYCTFIHYTTGTVQLQKVNLSVSDLICFDELNLQELLARKQLQLTLSDHNALAADLEDQYGPAVVEIIDHHVDRGYYPWVQQANGARHIAFDKKPTASSTCTLIAEAFFLQQSFLSPDTDTDDNSSATQLLLLNEDISTLLLAVIAVDSANMTNATPRDVEAVAV